jgi:hypothetical protein
MSNRYVTEKELEGHRRRVAAYRARKAAAGVKQLSLMASAAEAEQVRAFLAGIRDQDDVMPLRLTPYSILANFTGLSHETLAKRLNVPWDYFSLLIKGLPTLEARKIHNSSLRRSDEEILQELAQLCADALAVKPEVVNAEQDPEADNERVNFIAPVNNLEAREFGYPSLTAFCNAVTPVMVRRILEGDLVEIGHRHDPLEAYWKLNTTDAEHLGTITEQLSDGGEKEGRLERVTILQKNRLNLYFLTMFEQKSGPAPYTQLLSCVNIPEAKARSWLERLKERENVV